MLLIEHFSTTINLLPYREGFAPVQLSTVMSLFLVVCHISCHPMTTLLVSSVKFITINRLPYREGFAPVQLSTAMSLFLVVFFVTFLYHDRQVRGEYFFTYIIINFTSYKVTWFDISFPFELLLMTQQSAAKGHILGSKSQYMCFHNWYLVLDI